MDDERIVSSCLAGRREAFELLVKKYQAPILHLAWRILGDEDEAKDAAQDTFVQAFNNLQRFDRNMSFKSWIYSIACKRCIDRKRKEKSRWNFLQKVIRERPLYTKDEDRTYRIQDSGDLYRVLKKLSARERVAITLKVNDACSAAEIAKVLGCAEGTARVYLFNARKKLRKMLQGKEHVFIF